MKYLSEMEKPRPRSTPVHIFQSEHTALEHLKAYSIEPANPKRIIVIAERSYGEKTFDALDYLMYNHSYGIHWI